MKTIKRIFLSVITLCLFSLVLTSCFTSSTKSIKIVKIPNSVFEVVGEGDSKAVPDLMIVEVTDDVTTQIKLSIDENGQLVSSNNVFTITINGFDLSKVGSFTASVEYAGVVSYFDYQVVSKDSYFAGGDGSVNNPYQITNAEQFINMNKVDTTNKYFKLMNDIDFNEVDGESVIIYSWDKDEQRYVSSNWGTAYISYFAGELDGNSKKMYNIADPINYVFSELSGATIKNISLYVQGTEISLALAVNSLNGRKIQFVNVDMFGTLKTGYNYASYCIYPMAFVPYSDKEEDEGNLTYSWEYSNVLFKDCDCYIDNITTATRVGVFCAIPRGDYTFENSYNHGYVEALSASVLFTNGYASTYGAKRTTYRVISSGNKGTVSSVYCKSNLISTNGPKLEYYGTEIDAQEGSEEVVEGSNLVIKSLDFASLLQVADNKVQLKQVEETSEIVKVKVNLYFEGMSCPSYGTLTDYVSVELPVSYTEISDTGLFALDYTSGKLSIQVVVKGSEDDLTEESDEILSFDKEWLTYNVTKGFYIFDGTKVIDGFTFTKGSQRFAVFTYDANEKVVSSVSIATK